jgi:hypothetical protein
MPRDEVRECLAAIPNNTEDWSRWNTIGMRVYAATEGAAYGLEEWQRWSDTLTTKGSDACETRWETFHGSPPSRTGAGALVVEARAATGDNKWTPRGAILARTVPSAVPANPGLGPLQAVHGGVAVALPALVTPAVTTDLPPSYSRDPKGIVSLIGLDVDGNTTRTPVCDYPLTNPEIEGGATPTLNFTTTTERNRTKRIDLPLEIVGATEMRKCLQSQGIMLRSDLKMTTEFFVAWIKQLQASKDAITSKPFGWNDTRDGFAYAGSLYTAKGLEMTVAGDPTLTSHYKPTGVLQPWIDAAKMITDQDRPGMEVILASAFASPLMTFTGHKGILLSTWSQESGVGKTTAMTIAHAAWGDPQRAMQGLTDTSNALFSKIGKLQNLPLYWDEIKGEHATKDFVELVFRISGGKDKARQRANTTLRDVGIWNTILAAANNESILDYIVGSTNMTTAGLMRVFEFELRPGTKGQISPSTATRLTSQLNGNYGNVGKIYAEFLGQNIARCDRDIEAIMQVLEAETEATTEERLWLAIIGATLVGAKYANELELTDFDLAKMRKFMIAEMNKMRLARDAQSVNMKVGINISDKLAQFLNINRARHTIFTNKIHSRPGKPVPGSIKVIGDTTKLDGIYVHVGREDKLMRISSAALSDWLKLKSLSRNTFLNALSDAFHMTRINGRMGSGTGLAGANEHILQIDLSKSPLIDFIDEV